MTPEEEPYVQLLTLIVHELRTPANVVGGYLRMLQRDADSSLSDRQRKMVDEAERSCQRLVGFIGELSDIQKLDSQAIPLAQQPVDLFSLVQTVATEVEQSHEFEVRLGLQGPSNGASVRGDVMWLGRAFSSILRAVLRELPPGATAVVHRRIDSRQGHESAAVVIAAEELAETARDSAAVPFDEKRGGLGLALPLARRIIERHGGHVWSPPGDAGRAAAIVSLPLE
jgi:signal transduction histidine kinase